MEDLIFNVKRFLKNFNATKIEPVKVVVRNCSDGILSACILINMFKKEEIKFSLVFENNLNKGVVKELKLDSAKTILFVKFDPIEIDNKDVFVINNKGLEGDNSLGDEDVSCAGICYILAKESNASNKNLVYLGFLGCIAEKQEKDVFSKINNFILQEAIESKKIRLVKGLRIFPFQVKPLHKILEDNFYPFLPGISGNRESIMNFLKEININIKDDKGFRNLIDMSETELKNIFSAVIIKTLGEVKEEVFGNLYIVKLIEETEDANGIITYLDTFVKLRKPHFGLALFSNNKKLIREAIGIFYEFSKEVINSLQWYWSNRKTEDIIERESVVVINTKFSEIVTNTFIEIIIKSQVYEKNKIIITLLQNPEGNSKMVFYFDDRERKRVEEMTKELSNIKVEKDEMISLSIPNEREEEIVKFVKEWFENKKIEEIVK